MGLLSVVANFQRNTVCCCVSFPVFEIRIVVAPENATVVENDTILLTCVAYGLPYSAITWRMEGMDLVNSSRISIYDKLVTEQGLVFTQSILEICSSELSDDGTYECIADNGVSNDSVTFTISVLPDESMLKLVKTILSYPITCIYSIRPSPGCGCPRVYNSHCGEHCVFYLCGIWRLSHIHHLE